MLCLGVEYVHVREILPGNVSAVIRLEDWKGTPDVDVLCE